MAVAQGAKQQQGSQEDMMAMVTQIKNECQRTLDKQVKEQLYMQQQLTEKYNTLNNKR